MKKLLLSLLLVSSFSFGQSYQDISDLIDSNLSNNSKITAQKHREVEHAILTFANQNAVQSGDMKLVKCDLEYYQANFEASGLGKNLRLGWAVCNGNNGTYNMAGRVAIGQGLGYSSFGSTGGNKDAVVVEHSHSYSTSKDDSGDDGQYVVTSPREPSGNKKSTDVTGVSGTDKNMQPYVIVLYIQKL